MKAVFEQIKADKKQSLLFRKIELPNFDAPFHFHPEYELTYISKGEGLRYVGMKVEEFRAGELVFLGPNLPHCWLNTKNLSAENVEALVIQFPKDLFEQTILNLPEFESIKTLFKNASEGILFDGISFESKLELLFRLEPLYQFLGLINFFIELNQTKWQSILGFIPSNSLSQQRFQAIFAYIIEHFKDKIELEKIAEIAKMSPTSFCRYFKNETGKTLFEVILNYRLETASQLLIRTNKRINEIAFESGFEDLPYFNRTFKKWKGVNPTTFRKMDK